MAAGDPHPYGINTGDFQFYFGASGGGARRTIREMREPNIMISFTKRGNKVYDTANSVMVDCGAFGSDDPFSHPRTLEEYLDWIDANAELIDYAMARDILVTEETVEAHPEGVCGVMGASLDKTEETFDAARERGLDDEVQFMAVLQGMDPIDYLEYYERLRARGIETDYLGIGSIKPEPPAVVAETVTAVRSYVGDDVHLHGLGIDVPELQMPGVREALDTADSSRYSSTARYRTVRGENAPILNDTMYEKSWYEIARAYLEMREDLRYALAESLERDAALEDGGPESARAD